MQIAGRIKSIPLFDGIILLVLIDNGTYLIKDAFDAADTIDLR